MVDNFEWPPLESNPEIFTEYMTKCGLPSSWGFSELFGFDEDLLAMIPQPCLAVIVNLERLQDDKTKGSSDVKAHYYMKQTGKLDNACGVIACIHSIFNNLGQIALEEGKTLANYHAACQGKSAEERATILENFTQFQESHKEHAGQGQSNLASC